MKFVCEKCGIEFEDKGDCYRHEEICGLQESDICDMHFFEIQTSPVQFFDRQRRVPYSSLGSTEFDVPYGCDDYQGDFFINVEGKNKDNGLRKLFEFASKKTQERIDKLQEQLQKIAVLMQEKLGEQK